MAVRRISEGREVYDAEFPDIAREFSRMNWYKFLLIEEDIFPPIVYEFYSNFEFIDELVTFRMFGKNYSYEIEEFGDLLEIPHAGEMGCKFYFPSEDLGTLPQGLPTQQMTQELCRPDVSYETIKRTGLLDSYLRDDLAIRSEIIRSNMYHRDENVHCLSASEACLLWCLINENPIVNTAHLVVSRMSELHRDETKSLPYGALLNRLFAKIGVLRGRSIPLSTLPIRNVGFMNNPTGSDDPSTSVYVSSDSGTSSTRSDARSHARC